MYVPTVPTTVPTVTTTVPTVPTILPTVPATVPTVRTRCIPTAVQYVIRTATCTNCTGDVRTFTY